MLFVSGDCMQAKAKEKQKESVVVVDSFYSNNPNNPIALFFFSCLFLAILVPGGGNGRSAP